MPTDDAPTTKPCPNCGAALPLTGTFCLACDTPVKESTGGLSVAETHAVRQGRPLVGIALVGGVGLVVVAVIAALIWVSRPHDSTKDVKTSVMMGAKALIKAEGGKILPCSKLPKYLAGDETVYRPQCRALVGSDPGALLTNVTVSDIKLGSEKGTAHLTGTITDAKGSRTFSRDFDVNNDSGSWRLVWDGTKLG